VTRIPVLYAFARSGGTLVNQILGVAGTCIVLSEINPSAFNESLSEQVSAWFALVSDDEIGQFSRLPYHKKIRHLHDAASLQEKRLVIRDWPTINFLPGAAEYFTMPSRLLEQEIYLKRAGFEQTPLVVTRRGDCVYDSIKENFPHLVALSIETFAKAYLAYAQAVSEFPKVRLESLRRKPKETVQEILKAFNLDEDPDYLLNNFFKYKKCTGNITLKVENKSARAESVLDDNTAPRKKYSYVSALSEADGLLGYV